MTRPDSSVSFPEPFLHISNHRVVTNPLDDLIRSVQIHVKASLDKIKEELNWEEYLNGIQPESKVTDRPTVDITNNVDKSAPKSQISAGTLRQRGRVGPESTVKKPETVRKRVQQNASVPPKTLPPRMPPQKQSFQKEIFENNSASLGRSERCIKYESNNIRNLTRTLASKEDIERLSRTLPSKEDVQRLARILISKELVQRHLRTSAPSSSHTNSRLQRVNDKPDVSSILRRPTLVKKKSTAREMPISQKKMKSKNVTFSNNCKKSDAKIRNQVILKNETEQQSSSETSSQQITEQLNDLKQVRSDIEIILAREAAIQRKWNCFHRSASSKQITATPNVVMHEPLARLHLDSRNVIKESQKSARKRRDVTNRINKLERVADCIFEDTVSQVAKELSQISEDCISRLYEEEFHTSSSGLRGFV